MNMCDDVRGVIIGGDFVVGSLHNEEGFQQGPKFYGDNDEDVRGQAQEWFLENGGKSVWSRGLELRLW